MGKNNKLKLLLWLVHAVCFGILFTMVDTGRLSARETVVVSACYVATWLWLILLAGEKDEEDKMG